MKKKMLRIVFGSMFLAMLFTGSAYSEETEDVMPIETEISTDTEVSEETDAEESEEADADIVIAEEDMDVLLEEEPGDTQEETQAEEEQILESVPVTQMEAPIEEDVAGENMDLRMVEAAVGYYNVKDYGAVPNDKLDDAAAINKALAYGLSASKKNPITVYVPAGTYYISTTLNIYSYTTLELHPDAKIISTAAGRPMLYGRHKTASGTRCPADSTCTHGGYTQVQNVVITGGTWKCADDRNGTNTAISIRHGNNLTVKDTTILDSTEHFMNLSGSANVLVSNVTFKDQHLRTDSDPVYWNGHTPGSELRGQTMEAIHLDCIYDPVYKKGEQIYPFDGTPCKNAVIEGCHFENLYSAAGNHHGDVKGKERGFVVKNSTFKNIKYYALWTVYFDDAEITNNTFINCGSLSKVSGTNNLLIADNQFTISSDSDRNPLMIDDSTGLKIVGNTLIGGSNIIRIDGSSAEISGNTIKNFDTNGIFATNSDITVNKDQILNGSGNGIHTTGKNIVLKNVTINTCGAAGILIDNAETAALLGNTVANTTGNGIGVKGCKAAYLEGNTVTGAGGHALYAIGTASQTENIQSVKNKYVTVSSTARDVRIGDYVSGIYQGDEVGTRGRSIVSGSTFTATTKPITPNVPIEVISSTEAPTTTTTEETTTSTTETSTTTTTTTTTTQAPTVKLSASAFTLQVGRSVALSPYVKGMIAGDKIASWSTDKPAIAKVSSAGKVVAGKYAGTAKITVKTQKGAKAVFTIKVQKGVVKAKTLTVPHKAVTLKVRKTYRIVPKRTPVTVSEPLKYATSNRKVAVVSANGVITAKKKGKATIVVKSGTTRAVKIVVTVK